MQNRVLRSIIFVDVETKPKIVRKDISENQLIYGYAKLINYYPDGQEIFTNDCEFTHEDIFWKWFISMCDMNPHIMLIAHNCLFDLQVLHFEQWLEKFGFLIVSPYHSATTTIYKLNNGNTTLTILDNMNWFPMSLKVLGDSIGLPKYEVDFDTVSMKALAKYCKNDVEIMVRAQRLLHTLVQSEKGAEWRQTLPSMSFRLWFNAYKPRGYWSQRPKEIKLLERQSYHGGRVEVFRMKPKPNETVYKLDVNSMYPYVMIANKYPSRFIAYSEQVTKKLPISAFKEYTALAEVELKTDISAYPLVLDKKILYPIGTFTTWLCTPEIIYALEHNHVKSIKRIIWYFGDDLFGNYVSTFYAKRKEAKENNNLGMNATYKLLLNSLYGKFGQMSIEVVGEDIDPNEEKHADYTIDSRSNILHQLAYYDHKRFTMIQKDESPLSFCAVASHVTAYARIYLWSLIEKAGLDNVFYCDTDSIFVNAKGKKNLEKDIDEYELGSLKIEGKSNDCAFFVPKDYYFGDEHKRKGIRKGAKQIDETTFQQDNFLSPNGRRIKKLPEGNYVLKQKKRLKRNYMVKIQDKASRYRSPILPDDLPTLKKQFKNK